ncbi:MAG: hypothetical protein WBL50_23575 [Candidatus Acidiferrum sp.]
MGNSALQVFLKTLIFSHRFSGLGDVFFQYDGVSQFAFSFALELL